MLGIGLPMPSFGLSVPNYVPFSVQSVKYSMSNHGLIMANPILTRETLDGGTAYHGNYTIYSTTCHASLGACLLSHKEKIQKTTPP